MKGLVDAAALTMPPLHPHPAPFRRSNEPQFDHGVGGCRISRRVGRGDSRSPRRADNPAMSEQPRQRQPVQLYRAARREVFVRRLVRRRHVPVVQRRLLHRLPELHVRRVLAAGYERRGAGPFHQAKL